MALTVAPSSIFPATTMQDVAMFPAVSEYLATLEQQGLPKTVVFLREHEADI